MNYYLKETYKLVVVYKSYNELMNNKWVLWPLKSVWSVQIEKNSSIVSISVDVTNQIAYF